MQPEWGGKRNMHRLLVGKRPLARPRWKWVDNIRMNLIEVGWGDVDWVRIGTDVLTTGDLSSSGQLLRVS
jgi:hypothetical protein